MPSNTGKVYLVGAGPGDPSLITVKGLDILRTADAIVFDRLVSPRLLLEARASAEMFDVGKSPGNHRMTQDQINKLLVDLGSKGKTYRIVTHLRMNNKLFLILCHAGVADQVSPPCIHQRRMFLPHSQ